jgi:hypothetical protein
VQEWKGKADNESNHIDVSKCISGAGINSDDKPKRSMSKQLESFAAILAICLNSANKSISLHLKNIPEN